MDCKIYDYRDLGLQSLDLLVCSGEGKMSKAIRKFNHLTGVKGEAAELSHTARIYKGYLCDKLEVIESTTLNDWTNPPKKGVQKNPFDLWLKNYNGVVWVIQLCFERTQEFYEKDYEFWNKHKNDPYESGILGGAELLLCGLKLDRVVRLVWPNYKPLETKNPHCSELIIKNLQWHGFLNGINANRMPPSVFWPDGDLYKYVRCVISEPKRIK